MARLPVRTGVTPYLLKKLSVFADPDPEQIKHLESLDCPEQSLPAGSDIIRAGDRYGPVLVLSEGIAIRYRILDNGRRQIVNFVLPGDFMCLNAIVMPRADYDITAVTAVRCCQIRVEDMIVLIERHPVLCAAIFWCNAREEAMMVEHLISLGRRSALQRVAHLLVELWRRHELLGLIRSGSIELPLTQEQIGDCLGLTSVHVSRMLTELQSKGLVTWRHRPTPRLTIHDIKGLAQTAGFEDGYLHFTELPKRTRDTLQQLTRLHASSLPQPHRRRDPGSTLNPLLDPD